MSRPIFITWAGIVGCGCWIACGLLVLLDVLTRQFHFQTLFLVIIWYVCGPTWARWITEDEPHV